MKRRRGSTSSGLERAEARVVRLLGQISRQDLPIAEGWTLQHGQEVRILRREAEHAAIEAGRGALLTDARGRVAHAYAIRFADVGIPSDGPSHPSSAGDRAASQAAISDLVTAAVVEDLLPLSSIAALRAGGEWLLDVGDVRPGTSAATPVALLIEAAARHPRAVRAAVTLSVAGLAFLLVLFGLEDAVLAILAGAATAALLLLSMSDRLWAARRTG